MSEPDAIASLIAYITNPVSLSSEERNACHRLFKIIEPHIPTIIFGQMPDSKQLLDALRYVATINPSTHSLVSQVISSHRAAGSQNVTVSGNGNSVITVGGNYNARNTPSNESVASAAKQTTRDTLLYLGADPTGKLRIADEARLIARTLRNTSASNQLALEAQVNAGAEDISRALLTLNPRYVHISTDGMFEENRSLLGLSDKCGNTRWTPTELLAGYFENANQRVTCVVLSACHSAKGAKPLARHVDYVIGMKGAIRVEASLAFAVGFYQALAAGRSILDALDFGRQQTRIQKFSEYDIPVLVN